MTAAEETCEAWGVCGPEDSVRALTIRRRAPEATDVVLDVWYCGVCHSDVHHARNEWGTSIYPMVPGHEIVGLVRSVGASVTRVRAGDVAGVGTFVGSCEACEACEAGEEQYCPRVVWTYDCVDERGRVTHGGFSTRIVVAERFVLPIPRDAPDLPGLAPLLCAGLTVYSPLSRFQVATSRVLVLGYGGLGHLALKFATMMGYEVVVASRSAVKRERALVAGANEVVSRPDEFRSTRVGLVLDTISAPHDLSAWMRAALDRDGTCVLVGLPTVPPTLDHFDMCARRLSVSGSVVGSMSEAETMLRFAVHHGIRADVHHITPDEIEDAFRALQRGDDCPRQRFVVDFTTATAR